MDQLKENTPMNRIRLKMLIACVAFSLANTACTIEDAPPNISEQTETDLQPQNQTESDDDGENRDQRPVEARQTIASDGQEECLSPTGEPEEGCHSVPDDQDPSPQPERRPSPAPSPRTDLSRLPSEDRPEPPPHPEDRPEPPPLPHDGPEPPPHPDDEPQEEDCDGLDNDQDGEIDEAPECVEPEPFPIPGPEPEPTPEDDCDGLDNDQDGVIDESPECFEPEPPAPPEERDNFIAADCSEFEDDSQDISNDGVCEAAGLIDGRQTCYIYEQQPQLRGREWCDSSDLRPECIIVQYCIGQDSTDTVACERREVWRQRLKRHPKSRPVTSADSNEGICLTIR